MQLILILILTISRYQHENIHVLLLCVGSFGISAPRLLWDYSTVSIDLHQEIEDHMGRKMRSISHNIAGRPGKFCNRLLTEILVEVPISRSLTEFNQPFNR